MNPYRLNAQTLSNPTDSTRASINFQIHKVKSSESDDVSLDVLQAKWPQASIFIL